MLAVYVMLMFNAFSGFQKDLKVNKTHFHLNHKFIQVHHRNKAYMDFKSET